MPLMVKLDIGALNWYVPRKDYIFKMRYTMMGYIAVNSLLLLLLPYMSKKKRWFAR
jgi:hypothetical protein